MAKALPADDAGNDWLLRKTRRYMAHDAAPREFRRRPVVLRFDLEPEQPGVGRDAASGSAAPPPQCCGTDETRCRTPRSVRHTADLCPTRARPEELDAATGRFYAAHDRSDFSGCRMRHRHSGRLAVAPEDSRDVAVLSLGSSPSTVMTAFLPSGSPER